VLPNVSLGASGNKNGTDTPVVSKAESYSVSAKAGIPVFDGFASPNNIIAAFETSNAAAYTFNEKSAQVRYDVYYDYINALKAAKLVEVTEGISDRRKIQMEQVKLRYEGGRENIGAVRSAEADYAKAVSEYSAAQRQFVFAVNELKRSCGISLNAGQAPEGSLDIADTEAVTFNAQAEALLSNYYLAAVCRRKAAEASYRSALSVFSPDVNLSASAGRSGDAWPPDNRSWSLGLSASFNIFSGGANIARVQAAGDNMESAKADEREAFNTAVSGFESANNLVLEAFDNAKVSEKTLEAAETRAMIADSQYSNGIMDYDSWTLIQDNLMAARKNNIQSKAAYFLAKAAVEKAKGRVLDEK